LSGLIRVLAAQVKESHHLPPPRNTRGRAYAGSKRTDYNGIVCWATTARSVKGAARSFSIRHRALRSPASDSPLS